MAEPIRHLRLAVVECDGVKYLAYQSDDLPAGHAAAGRWQVVCDLTGSRALFAFDPEDEPVELLDVRDAEQLEAIAASSFGPPRDKPEAPLDLDAVSARYSLASMAGSHAVDSGNGWDSSTAAALSRSWQDVYYLFQEVKRLRQQLADRPLLAESPAGMKYLDGHMNGFRAGWESAWSTRMVGAGFAAPELSGHATPPRELFDAIRLVDVTLKAHLIEVGQLPWTHGQMLYRASCSCGASGVSDDHPDRARAVSDGRGHQAVEVARALGLVLHGGERS